jgi:hypothetical protein
LEHDLVVVFKGFSQEAELAEWRTALARFPHQELRMSDFGFDIRVYSLAARWLPHRYFCFLNSFSELFTPAGVQNLFYAITQRSPPPESPRRPPSTLWQPFGLTAQE